MIQLELSESSADLLRDVLQWYLSELRGEIAATDRKAFRDGLKEKKVALMEIVDQLSAQLHRHAASSIVRIPHTD